MGKIKCLSGFQLKVLAIVIMTVDHVGAILFPQEMLFRQIGRLAFPIFCFLIVEGVTHTSDIKKYLVRLGVFALVSEIPFDWGFHKSILYLDAQNVFFTLFLGALGVSIWKSNYKYIHKLSLVVVILVVSEIINCDYGIMGVILILLLANNQNDIFGLFLSLFITNVLGFGGIQSYALLSFIPLVLYNGERGYSLKNVFYIYYPVHILVLALLTYYI